MATRTKPTRKLTLRDRLSRLNYQQACKLLGAEGKQLIIQGSQFDTVDLEQDVYLRGDLFRLLLRSAGEAGQDVRVSITTMASRPSRLHCHCDTCETPCLHLGAALSLILESKYALGLSDLPQEGVPLELLSEDQLVERAIAERAKRAREERFRMVSTDRRTPWTEYTVSSEHSGKTYHVVLRGEQRGQSYCSCPDFRVNTLGTCKHILYALKRVQNRFTQQQRSVAYRPTEFTVHLKYGQEVSLWFDPPCRVPAAAREVAGAFPDRPVTNVRKLLRQIQKLERAGYPVTIYPDAEQWIRHHLFQEQVDELVQEIRQDPAGHPLRKHLLRTELLPYQLEGIAFAVGAGRAILADDMGLGKTIQGVGVAELLARVTEIRRVLIICPASLKSQWRAEIQRFSGRDCQLVIGSAEERREQYDSDCFFTICNYEQVLRDIQSIEPLQWDLIILDEAQRIKNWEAKTSRVIKGLKSNFALALSGTPLENRLDELYSVVQFIDDRRLAPAFRFFHRHRMVDENGKVIGYKNLDSLRENLRPVMLRRTRQSVLQQLPERTTEVVRIPPSREQKELNDSHVRIAAQIASKKFLTEMDLLRLQKSLLAARMSANSTFLVNKRKPGCSTKLEYLDGFIEQLFREEGRKAVLFSEWTTMLDLIQPLLDRHQVSYVRLDGSVPQKKRQQLVHQFQHDDACQLFLTTNAGSTGLNLQAANTVINVDLPWNPAVLEQRIARAHRMGQHRPVDVYLLVTEDTLEERLLGVLADKQQLALAALDAESDVSQVHLQTGMDDLKQRLEILLGAQPAAPVDKTQRAEVLDRTQRAESDARQAPGQPGLGQPGLGQPGSGQQAAAQRRERVAAAGGELLGAVFGFLNELVRDGELPAPPNEVVESLQGRLDECVEQNEDGSQRLTLTLPNRESLQGLARSLAQLMMVDSSQASGTSRKPR